MKKKYLKISLFDVGHGDCIAIRFPNGEVGVVDSNTRSGKSRSPAIDEIKASGGKIKFLCLTHPHSDHFSGMLSMLRDPEIEIEKFWHPLALYLETFLKSFNERSVFSTSDAEFISERICLDSPNGELLDIFDHLATKRSIAFSSRISEFQHLDSIGGVDVIAMSPAARFSNYYEKLLVSGLSRKVSGEEYLSTREYGNKISIVLCLKFGKSQVILGADAVVENWKAIVMGMQRRGFGKQSTNFFKVPHHGARDSFYSDMWTGFLARKGVLAVSCGRPQHPSVEFIESVRRKWAVHCTNGGNACKLDGVSEHLSGLVKLGLDQISKSAEPPFRCCSDIEVKLFSDGHVEVNTGTLRKEFCPVY